MRAFMESTMKGSPETALEWLDSALEVLVWGRERYSGVSSEEKGAIFQHTFIRGVKCLRLNDFMTVHCRALSYTSKRTTLTSGCYRPTQSTPGLIRSTP